MKNELLNIKLSDKGTIKSTELVEIINSFRAIEGKTELLHKNFMRSIRTEVVTLKLLGIDTGYKFVLSSYINKQNKKQPCFELNGDGMLQMLNGESALVRFKTIEYIRNLEKEVQLLNVTVIN